MDEIQRIGTAATDELTRLTPTAKQLELLKALAYRRGGSFVVPVTRQQAHAEIQRLMGESTARAKRRAKRKRRPSPKSRGMDSHL